MAWPVWIMARMVVAGGFGGEAAIAVAVRRNTVASNGFRVVVSAGRTRPRPAPQGEAALLIDRRAAAIPSFKRWQGKHSR